MAIIYNIIAGRDIRHITRNNSWFFASYLTTCWDVHCDQNLYGGMNKVPAVCRTNVGSPCRTNFLLKSSTDRGPPLEKSRDSVFNLIPYCIAIPKDSDMYNNFYIIPT